MVLKGSSYTSHFGDPVFHFRYSGVNRGVLESARPAPGCYAYGIKRYLYRYLIITAINVKPRYNVYSETENLKASAQLNKISVAMK